MGMYDRVMVPCPCCGAENEFQSKGAAFPTLTTYSLEDVPPDVYADINRHAPIECENCGTEYEVNASKEPVKVEPLPYITKVITKVVETWNPKYPQEARCECGHPYYRHFDSYDGMEPVGCKYCECYRFKPVKATDGLDTVLE